MEADNLIPDPQTCPNTGSERGPGTTSREQPHRTIHLLLSELCPAPPKCGQQSSELVVFMSTFVEGKLSLKEGKRNLNIRGELD